MDSILKHNRVNGASGSPIVMEETLFQSNSFSKTDRIRAEPPASLTFAKVIGIDEAGRGPLFGRVYAAAVLLNDGFDVTKVKDSKKFTSEKKRAEAAEYIKSNSLWSVAYVDEGIVDQINVLHATLRCMHTAIHELLDKHGDKNKDKVWIDQGSVRAEPIPSLGGGTPIVIPSLGGTPIGFELLVDGNYFKPLFRIENRQMVQIPHTCIEKGDAIWPCISAASILAKVARDEYVLEMCTTHVELEKYGLRKNKGYGTKAHRDAIKEYGLSPWHRKSFVLKN